MRDKVCVVTGASSGIGLAAASSLARMGAHVVLACRDQERGEAAVREIKGASPGAQADLWLLDLASLESIRTAAQAFRERYPAVHVLINNAGVWPTRRQTTAEGFELALGVNHLGHFLLTHLLLGALRKAGQARIVTVSSELHRRGSIHWDDLQLEKSFGGGAAYAQSKLANILFTRELAKRLPPTIAANSVHPGVIATDLARDFAWPLRALARRIFKSPEKGAMPLVRLAQDAELEGVTGRYFDRLTEAAPSALALDDGAAARLWRVSEELTGLKV